VLVSVGTNQGELSFDRAVCDSMTWMRWPDLGWACLHALRFEIGSSFLGVWLGGQYVVSAQDGNGTW